jgi:hypothetical protein
MSTILEGWYPALVSSEDWEFEGIKISRAEFGKGSEANSEFTSGFTAISPDSIAVTSHTEALSSSVRLVEELKTMDAIYLERLYLIT